MAILLQLGHADGNVTTVGFPFDPDHADLQVLRAADPEALNAHSQAQRAWHDSLPAEQQPYFTHLMQTDHLWPSHSEAAGPEWVSCPEHPVLEQALSEHFTRRGHTCTVKPSEAAPPAAAQPEAPPAEPAQEEVA